jgi:hypothetical protein
VLGIVAAICGFAALAAVWLHPGVPLRAKLIWSAVCVTIAAAIVAVATQIGVSVDLTEDRRNSFPAADQRALADLREPLIITVHFAPEDPRYVDLRRNVLLKLERVMPHVTIRLATTGQSMVGSTSEEAYGEVEIFLCRPLGQEPLDQPSRSPAAHLRAGGTAGSDADRRRGLSGLPVARQRIARPRLVPRRPSAPDRHRVVVEPPPAANRRPTHQTRRSTMTTSKHTIAITAAGVGLAALLTYASAAQHLKVDFSDETVGGEPKSFVSVVGVWRIENDGNNKVLVVDGRQWKEGQTSAGIADKARALYGDRYAEFLDRVQAYAYFPYVVAKDVTDFRDGEISVRFEGISGRIDQGAGILFNLKPNGDYLTVRANPLENNLVLWKFEKGKRSSVKWIRNTPTPTRQWHDLKVTIAGRKVAAYLDGKLYLEHTLPEPVSGRIGLWSKADSHMYFDDFTVTPAD